MAGKKKEKGSPSAIISSAAVAIFCIVAAAADYGAAAVIALIIALVSLGVNIHAFLKKKAASGSGSPKKKSPQTDYVPLRREEKPAYRPNPYDSEDYTRRRLEQLKRFLDAGLIDKAEYESEKRKI